MHPLLQSLHDREDVDAVTQESCNAFLNADRERLTALFFVGDVEKRPESLDVAVVLRELLAANAGRMRVGVVDPASEGALMKELKVFALPSLAFFAGDRILEVIPKIQDWSVYAEKLPGLMARVQETVAA